MKSLIHFVLLSILISCTTQLTEKGKSVTIVPIEEKINNCKNLGPVTGSNAMANTNAEDAEAALNEMRNKAAELGANTIFLTKTETSIMATTSVGIAYYCENN